jgi:mannitol/fructose-specific phosphotransferase system IIA component (Ntr-type)
LDEDALLPDILARETTHPTLLGHGVAVPQAVVEGLHHRTCAIARLKTEIPYMGEDSEPVRLVFLLLSPTGHRERHLATLGEIARMVSDYMAREKLIEAADAEAVLEVIQEYKPLRLQDDEATKYPSAIRQRGEHAAEEENGEDKSESQKLLP